MGAHTVGDRPVGSGRLLEVAAGAWRARCAMGMDDRQTDATRTTLLLRLQDAGDEEGWLEFFEKYWRLIYNVARRAGLSHEDAQDVVQETVVRVFKSIGDFDYDRQKGKFKNWLCVVTRSVIKMHFRREQSRPPKHERLEEPERDALEQIPDPRGYELEVVWDEEWHNNLLDVVLDRVRARVSERQFQLFHCYAIQEWSAREVSRSLGVSVAQVYLAKHRVGAVFREEWEQAKKEVHDPPPKE